MSIQRLTTWGGDYHINSSDDEITDGNFYGFTVEQDETTVDVMSGGPTGNMPSPQTDFLTECNISGKALSAGTRITIPLGQVIRNFSCSAGAVVLHKESEA